MGRIRRGDARRGPSAGTQFQLWGQACPVFGGREIAHLEAPGVIDLRISRKGWLQAKDSCRGDPAVRRDPSRRDWIELHLRLPADLNHLAGLLAIATAANS